MEAEFLSRWLAAARAGEAMAVELSSHVPPEAFTNDIYRDLYDVWSQAHARGEPLHGGPFERQAGQLAQAGGDIRAWTHVSSMAEFVDPSDRDALRHFGRQLVGLYRGRCQADLIDGAALLTRDALSGLGNVTVRQVADDLVDRLLNLHSRLGESRVPSTQEEIVAHLLERVNPDNPAGVQWPWAKLQRVVGTVVPGTVTGVTAYSGNGKTLLMANLFLAWVLAGVPVIVFPTEMGLSFLERVVSILARVPKHYAEEGDWRHATSAQMDRYRRAMQSLIGLPWDVVQQGNVSPAEVIARVRSLRRKYRGQMVIVIVDHLHRLLYPTGVKADDALGAADATRQFQNAAQEDREGGLGFICLYQPKKPEEEGKQFRPVMGATGIRGHGGHFNEMATHLTIWRRVVQCTPNTLTPWGTPRALYAKPTDLMPAAGHFGDPDTKLDDEHVYLLNDKHRIRGSVLDTLMLNIHAPSGFIYEDDWLAGTDQEDAANA